LVEAQRRGLISGVRSRLTTLRDAGYFIAESVIAAACLAGGEVP
jgi:predicted nucleic acid-binding protein